MSELIIACVRTGTRYQMEYVTKLRNMVARNLKRDYRMVCLTDQPERCSDVDFVDISAFGLPGWWGKMVLFHPDWRGAAKVVALDLDTVVCGELTSLADVPCEVGMLRSPVRSYNPTYPCAYNSSVIVLRQRMSDVVWSKFTDATEDIMKQCGHYGDQLAIQMLWRDVDVLNSILPNGYFLNYRQLAANRPLETSIINFGGKSKPDNCQIKWVVDEWV